MNDSPYTPSRSSCYTTPSTVPDSVRPGVWRDWQRFWDRLRRRPRADRRLEFRTGTKLVLEGTEYVIRYDMKWSFYLRLARHGAKEVSIRGSSAFGDGKPYVYADELQGAVDRLTVQDVMTG